MITEEQLRQNKERLELDKIGLERTVARIKELRSKESVFRDKEFVKEQLKDSQMKIQKATAELKDIRAQVEQALAGKQGIA